MVQDACTTTVGVKDLSGNQRFMGIKLSHCKSYQAKMLAYIHHARYRIFFNNEE